MADLSLAYLAAAEATKRLFYRAARRCAGPARRLIRRKPAGARAA